MVVYNSKLQGCQLFVLNLAVSVPVEFDFLILKLRNAHTFYFVMDLHAYLVIAVMG